ncbi:hypothetical protein [Calidifontibacter terrae]
MEHARNTDPEAPVRAAKEFLQNILYEDGIAAAVDAADSPTLLPGLNPITRHLLIIELLDANLYERLKEADPFHEETGDDYWSPLPYGGSTPTGATPATITTRATTAEPYEETRPGILQAARFEQATVCAHRATQTSAAVRTLAAARFATYDPPTGTPDMAPCDFVEHTPEHLSPWAQSYLAPALGLGPYQTDRLIEEALWMRTRTPELLDLVAHQGPNPRGGKNTQDHGPLATTKTAGKPAKGSTEVPINLDTIAVIARELQDARPETCETVQAAVLRRGIHHTTRVQARRSTRTLVTKHEAAAARTTAKKTAAQQQGVWFDHHPTPGLSMLSAVMPTEHLETLIAAIEEHAQQLHRDTKNNSGSEDRTLGQHRTDALFHLAMRGITLKLNLDIIIPSAHPVSNSADSTNSDGGNSGDDTLADRVTDPAAVGNGAPPGVPAVRTAFRAAPAEPADALSDALNTAGAIAFGRTGALSVTALADLVATYPGRAITVNGALRTIDDITGEPSGQWTQPISQSTNSDPLSPGGDHYRPPPASAKKSSPATEHAATPAAPIQPATPTSTTSPPGRRAKQP